MRIGTKNKVIMLSFTTIFFALFHIQCKKTEDIPVIFGSWRWVATFPPGSPASYPHYPLTPENSSVEEVFTYYSTYKYRLTRNNLVFDSGTIKLGHGSYTPYAGATNFSYDSISYYHNTDSMALGCDYYRIANDTLQIVPYLSGRYNGNYTLPGGGAKYMVRQ